MNKALLKGAIVSRGYTSEVVAQKIGLSKQGFSRKVTGKTEFKASEIQALIDLLKLSTEETMSIFFGE